MIEEQLQQVQQEIFALPVNMKVVASIDGMDLFSNESLQKRYVKAMRKAKRTKPIADKIEELTERETIIPCFLTKNLISLTAFKVFAPRGVKTIRGFYHSESDKIILLIDNNISWGFASNDFLSLLTLHEGMHMFANQKKMAFLSEFKNDLTRYYNEMYNTMFHLNNAKVDISPLISFMYKIFEMPMKGLKNKDLITYHDMMIKMFLPHTSLDKETFERFTRDYILLVKIYDKSINSFLNIVKAYPHITTPMYEAYSKAFNAERVQTICIQELIYPSEVICIMSEIRPQKCYSAFKKLK